MNKKSILKVLLCLTLAFQACKTESSIGSRLNNVYSVYKLVNYLTRGNRGRRPDNGPEKLPIIGGRDYDISLFGIEKLHPFDSTKYGKVQQYLENEVGVDSERLTRARMVTDEELLKIHTQEYLNSLRRSPVIAGITGVELLRMAPNFMLRRYLLNPMKLATGGTIEAAKLALRHGWAFNLGGGYHHAKRNEGGGFCVYADIPIAAEVLWEENPDLNIMVVDLDAHQGNGHEAVFGDDERVSIFDMYNAGIYPNDGDAKQYITFDVPVRPGIGGREYVNVLRDRLNNALNELQTSNRRPDLIIFNAGTDPLEGDPLGGMNVSEDHMIERDQIVFDHAKRRRIPIVYLTSGGYTDRSANLIGRSIRNILENVVELDNNQINSVQPLFENK